VLHMLDTATIGLMWVSVQPWEASPVVGLVGAAAAVLAAIGTVWAALYASRPRRALAYSATMRGLTENERVTWTDSVLPDADERLRAVIVTFNVRGSGRLDVPTSAFDNATPITLSVRDADVRAAIKVDTRRGGGLAPMSEVRDNKLEVGPGLFGRNQVVVYTLIVVTLKHLDPIPDKPHVTLTSAVIDTKLRTDKTDAWIRLGVVAATAALLFGITYGIIRFGHHTHISSHTATLLLAIFTPVVWQVFRDLWRDVIVPQIRRRTASEHGQDAVQRRADSSDPQTSAQTEAQVPLEHQTGKMQAESESPAEPI
jgi:hypothetical protein